MLTLTRYYTTHSDLCVHFTLSLTAFERTRSRHRFETTEGQVVFLRLPRGTLLRDGDILTTETEEVAVQIQAKPEPVLNVTAKQAVDLLRAAYHLGNRHVPLEITSEYLRLEVDPILKSMLENLGLEVTESLLPFQPEAGAYSPSHSKHDYKDHEH